MNKRAQGMSINVIVIAALCILVLVVLAFVFLGQARRTSTETGSCLNNGGLCKEKPLGGTAQDACGASGRVLNFACDDSGVQVCCLNV